MAFFSNKKIKKRIFFIIFFIILILAFIPIAWNRYTVIDIRNEALRDFKNNNTHTEVIRTYMGETDGHNFYYYIEYKENRFVYIAEYLCQMVDRKWIFTEISKKILREEK